MLTHSTDTERRMPTGDPDQLAAVRLCLDAGWTRLRIARAFGWSIRTTQRRINDVRALEARLPGRASA